jgi:hypothetical protein
MGSILKVFATWLVIGAGFTVADIISSELKYQYKEFSEEREEKKNKKALVRVINNDEGPITVVD